VCGLAAAQEDVQAQARRNQHDETEREGRRKDRIEQPTSPSRRKGLRCTSILGLLCLSKSPRQHREHQQGEEAEPDRARHFSC
jgi:hypothetical protein